MERGRVIDREGMREREREREIERERRNETVEHAQRYAREKW